MTALAIVFMLIEERHRLIFTILQENVDICFDSIMTNGYTTINWIKKGCNRLDIGKICAYIRENIHNDLSLEDLSKHFGYSKYHLSRRFKEETGYSYKQYVEALKIEKSIISLIDSNRNSKASFIDSQHESAGTFSNTFKKLTGLSPMLYKKSLNILSHTLINTIKHKGEVIYRSHRVDKGGRISVRLHYPEIHGERVSFVGLFKNGIPNSAPVVGYALYKQYDCVLDFIPEGNYYLLVTEIDLMADMMQYYVLNLNYRSKVDHQICVTNETDVHYDLMMRLSVPEDPPIVVNLPFIVKQALLKDHN